MPGAGLVLVFQSLNLTLQVLKRNLEVAALFWGMCLALAGIEAAIGANPVTALVFFASVPALIGYLVWVNRSLLPAARHGSLGIAVLGACVLGSASAIVFVGLFAAAHLETLIATGTGAYLAG